MRLVEMTWLSTAAIALAGCGDNGMDVAVDAGADAAPAHCVAPTTDAHAAAMHTLFVNFDGVTLTKCNHDDARVNCYTSIPADTVFPPFMDGNPNRQAFIDSLLYGARHRLEPYSIDVVTTRPADGDYYMVVFGGTPALVGAPAGIFGIVGITCTGNNPNRVALIFDQGQAPAAQDYATAILGNVGAFAGMTATSADPANPYDCLCIRECKLNGTTCTFGTAVPVDPNGANTCGRTTQDDQAMLRDALGCRQ